MKSEKQISGLGEGLVENCRVLKAIVNALDFTLSEMGTIEVSEKRDMF